MKKEELIETIFNKSHVLAKYLSVDYSYMNELHSDWIKKLIFGYEVESVLFAYRNSGKSESIGVIGVCLYLLLYPKNHIILYMQAEENARDRIKAVREILTSPEYVKLWNIFHGNTKIIKSESNNIIDFNVNEKSIQRTLRCMGILSRKKTGTHPDLVILDDIVDAEHFNSEVKRNEVRDRVNEIRRTLSFNNKNKGRLISIGTPYHVEDANQSIPYKIRYPIDRNRSKRENDLYERFKKTLSEPEFKSQYLLEFSELSLPPFNFTYYEKDVFKNDPYKKVFHLDISGEGKDYTALTGVVKDDGNYIVYGKLFRNFMDNVKEIYEIVGDNTLYVEKNRNETSMFYLIRDKYPFKVRFYPEAKNKHLKIWNLTKYKHPLRLYFDKETSFEYKEQINKYTEKAINDDAPDSLSSIMTYFEKYVPKYRANTEFLKDSKEYENYLQKQFVNNYTF